MMSMAQNGVHNMNIGEEKLKLVAPAVTVPAGNSVFTPVAASEDVKSPNGVQNQQESTFSVAGDSTRMFYFCSLFFF